MRQEACQSWIKLAENSDFCFLTGDLGFQALEPLRDIAGVRFINAGVSEQNMVSAAAGLAKVGLRPWVYSIAPFSYARPFEQIRNDVCLHHLPVMIVGNGGGYGYGPMGATHHAIEDYGTMLTLQNMRAWVPSFNSDVWPIVSAMRKSEAPGYLRLGRDEKPNGFLAPEYSPWRKLTNGCGKLIVSIGAICGTLLGPAFEMSEDVRPEIWVLTELPLIWENIPKAFIDRLQTSDLLVVEEHVSQGGLGQILGNELLSRGCLPKSFKGFSAKGYLSGNYGSQAFHLKENGLQLKQILGSKL